MWELTLLGGITLNSNEVITQLFLRKLTRSNPWKLFDPNLHEALAEVQSAEHEPGTVMEEMEKGYKLNDKVVRPSRVVVSKAIEEKWDANGQERLLRSPESRPRFQW